MKRSRIFASVLAIALAATLCFVPLGFDAAANETNSTADIQFRAPANGMVRVTFHRNVTGDSTTWARDVSVGGTVGQGNMPSPGAPPVSHWFAGWNRAADGGGTWFQHDTVVNENIHVYAIWRRDTTGGPRDPDPRPTPPTTSPPPGGGTTDTGVDGGDGGTTGTTTPPGPGPATPIAVVEPPAPLPPLPPAPDLPEPPPASVATGNPETR